MRVPEDALLLRIFIGEDDKHDGQPLYRVIIGGSLVTLEKVRVVKYGSGEGDG